MKIVGLIGAKGSGKSKVASYMEVNHGYYRHPMAMVLKNMLASAGLTERQLNGDLKEVPCPLLCGHSPRFAMQTIGTEWGRNLIGTDLWCALTEHSLRTIEEDGHDVFVIDDIRFPNEVAMIRRLGGELWSIRRECAEVRPSWLDRVCANSKTLYCVLMRFAPGFISRRLQHSSEVYWYSFVPDRTIINDGGFYDLSRTVAQYLQDTEHRRAA